MVTIRLCRLLGAVGLAAPWFAACSGGDDVAKAPGTGGGDASAVGGNSGAGGGAQTDGSAAGSGGHAGTGLDASAVDGSSGSDSGPSGGSGGTGSGGSGGTGSGGSGGTGSAGSGGSPAGTCAGLPTADETLEHDWTKLPVKTYQYGDIFSGFHVNAPTGRITSGPKGLTFRVVAGQSCGNAPSWACNRAEVREQPLTAPAMGTTQVYVLRFIQDEMQDPLKGPVTIFQRFNKAKDGPDLDVELAYPGQFVNTDPNSVVIQGFGVWTHPNIKLKPLGQQNRLVIAIHNAAAGAHKVVLNGQVLAQGSGNTTPDPAYTGPQFGIYNHGGNVGPLQITHLSYARCGYTAKPDFSKIQ